LAPASAAVRPPAPAVDLRERECGQQREQREQRDRERPGERVVEGRRGLRGGRACLGQRARQRDLSIELRLLGPPRVPHEARDEPGTEDRRAQPDGVEHRPELPAAREPVDDDPSAASA
jgi:hypothetical protein